MPKLPSIGVVTAITNAVSSHYYAYLAFVDSWSRIADQVVVVDGGSTDNSLRRLRSWLGSRRNITVISSDSTFWGKSDRWHGDQLGININVGIKALTTDWGFIAGADHVVDIRTVNNVRQELASLANLPFSRVHRGKPGTRGIHRRLDTRTYGINLRLFRLKSVLPVLGMDLATGIGSDWPLLPMTKTTFRDPCNGAVKTMYAGYSIPVPNEAILSMECISYGHSFFTPAECLDKVRRWSRADARFLGVAPKRDAELKLLNGLHSIRGFLDKTEVMKWDHPPEMLRVIEEFYEPPMLLGAIRGVSLLKEKLIRTTLLSLKAERRLRTLRMRLQGYRGLKDLHQWLPLDAQEPEPLDVAEAYAMQDRFLPRWAHLSV